MGLKVWSSWGPGGRKPKSPYYGGFFFYHAKSLKLLLRFALFCDISFVRTFLEVENKNHPTTVDFFFIMLKVGKYY